MSKVVCEREDVVAIASAVRNKAGISKSLTLGEIATGINEINTEPDLQNKIITENGEYSADYGYYGLNKVTVNVPDIPAVLQSIEVTENGTYTPPNGVDGFNSVVVDIPERQVVLQDKTITENGTYSADEGFDGLGNVTVEVASSGGDGLQLEGDFLKYVVYQLDNTNKEIIIYAILWTQLYEDTGKYDVNIPSSFGAYQVVIASKGVE